MDKVEARYALESTSQPLAFLVARSQTYTRRVCCSLPTIEDIEAELNE